MPAQSYATIWTGLLSATTGTVAVGSCMCLDADGDYYVVATSAARTAASRTSCVAGIAITAGDSSNRSVEIQTVGPCPPSITGLGAGTASQLIVNSSGRLERSASPSGSDIVAGRCDADGWAYLNFTSRDSGGSGAPTDASYLTLATNATLTNERVLTAGTGISITDGGAGGNATIACTVTQGAPMDASYVTISLNGSLSGERVLTAGTGISITDGGANGNVTIAATGGSFTSPTGTGFAHVTSGALDAAATANVRYASGYIQSDNGYQFKNGANLGTITWAPSAARSISFPDASDTVAVLAASQTLTNKTINATNNTITDTSAVSGDILVHNGTRFVRQAKGANNTFLGVNGSGVVGYYTVSASPGGADTHVQYNSSGSFGGNANFAWNNSSAILTVTGRIIGTYVSPTGTMPASGFIRMPYSASLQEIIRGFWASGNEMEILGVTGSIITLGDDANSTTTVDGFSTAIYGRSGGVTIGHGASATTAIRLDGANMSLFASTFPDNSNPCTRAIFIANGTVPCNATPTGGGYLWASSGAGKWEGPSGTETTFGTADPHCDQCGRDFSHEWSNPLHDEHLSVCMPCLLGSLERLGVNVNAFSRRQLHS